MTTSPVPPFASTLAAAAAILAVACTTSAPPPAADADLVAPADDAGALPEACRAPEVRAMLRPSGVGDPRAAFRYRFAFRRPAPGMPTVVHLPGGPGSTSIGQALEWVPPSFGLVSTDPRGVGCNPVADVDPAAFYTTEAIAGDVVAMLAVLRAEGALGAFVLHGHSYGTLLATHVAQRLAEGEGPAPEAVVLEGVMGRAFTGEWMGQAYVDEWTLQRARLSPGALAQLAVDAPLGLDGKTWGNFFMLVTSQLGPETTHGALALLEPGPDGRPVPTNVSQLRDLVARLGAVQVGAGEALRLQRYVACREITRDLPTDNVDVVLSGGEIVASPDVGTLCAGLPLASPYHAAAHPFPFRTVYFLGDHDTATPPWQGHVHFDAHEGADRVEVTVEGAGHLPLARHLAACAPALVERIAAGSGFGEALATCPARVSVRSARASAPEAR